MDKYELANATSGQRLSLSSREWEMLLSLAERNDWEPVESRDYFQGMVFEVEAFRMAAAIKRAMPDVPTFYASPPEEELPPRRTLERLRYRPGDKEGDPLAYFSQRGRTKLIDFVNIASSDGGFIIRPLPDASTEL
jgi:hypothetical protein